MNHCRWTKCANALLVVAGGAAMRTTTSIIQTCHCHLVRIVRIQYGFWSFLRWYNVIRIWGKLLKNNLWICVAKKKVLSSTQLSFSAKFPKNGRFYLPWSTIDLVNQRRRSNPTLASREVKLRFWSLLAGCRFLLHNVAMFLQTASRYESRERIRDTSMHKWRIRIDTDFHWKNTDFPHEIVACLIIPVR